MKYINRGRNWYLYGQLDYAITGLIIGDALGVPVEFKSREYLDAHPVTEMIGYGTHNKPSGTWSDDTSLTLALADSIAASEGNLDYQDIMDRFSRWLYHGDYTSDGEVFDVGNTTRKAISRFSSGVAPLNCGGNGEHENGNGSLMRILPLAFYLDSHDLKVLSERGISIISDVSSLTHAHPISRLACIFYLALCECIISETKDDFVEGYKYDHDDEIVEGKLYDKTVYQLKIASVGEEKYYQLRNKRYTNCLDTVYSYLESIVGTSFYSADELQIFHRISDMDFINTPRDEIKSTGYVVHSLEAAIWCFLNARSYKEAVLAAVNLGDDTDTTAAICGGLAGMYSDITRENVLFSGEWSDSIVGKEVAEHIIKELNYSLGYNKEDIVEKEITNRDTWKHQSIVKPREIKVSLYFSKAEFEMLKEGIYPYEMEDKWFAYYEDGRLYFHRSWTGLGIHEAEIHPKGKGYAINSFITETDVTNMNERDIDDVIQEFYYLIYVGLLWRDVPKQYLKPSEINEATALSGWSSFGRMLFDRNGLIDEDSIDYHTTHNVHELSELIDSGYIPRYLFFWHRKPYNIGGCLSQWHQSYFIVDDVVYSCMEQYMMAEKARLFADDTVWDEIMEATDPKVMKKLGRKVSGYDSVKWDENKYSIVLRGNMSKFTQNSVMRQYLLATGEAILVEASPLDNVWGIGLSEDNAAALHPEFWTGDNLLGFALMEVRDSLRGELQSKQRISLRDEI